MISINNTLDSYLQNVEIKGNTIQNESDLSDIKSVGDKVEGQELYRIPILCTCKNLFNGKLERGHYDTNTGNEALSTNARCADFIRVNPNSKISLFRENTNGDTWILEYDANKKFLKTSFNSLTTLSSTRYIKFYIASPDFPLDCKIVVNYGTQATLYEPYQSHELTILSPTPIEKVGDVTDRIIEKDGVWGVEKNNIKAILKDVKCYDANSELTIFYCNGSNIHNVVKKRNQHNPFICNDANITNISFGGNLDVIFKDGVVSKKEDVNKYFEDNDVLVYFQVENPEFIPLPNSQQIALRTFANKTNISFLTEIEGTIKADVAKSINASVKSNTQAIQNLNKDLEKVKKLEEATTVTVCTNNGYTTCKDTVQGKINNIKIKGNSLVNLNINPIVSGKFDNFYFKDIIICNTDSLSLNKDYTFVIFKELGASHNSVYNFFEFGVANTIHAVEGHPLMTIGDSKVNRFDHFYNNDKFEVITFKIRFQDFKGFKYLAWRPIRRKTAPVEGEFADYTIKSILLEGDYSKNPPKDYFEGIQSVGTSTDKIEVLSRKENGNLFDVEEFKKIVGVYNSSFVTKDDRNCWKPTNYNHYFLNLNLDYKFKDNTIYTIKFDVLYKFHNNNCGLYFRFAYTDGTYTSFAVKHSNKWETYKAYSRNDKKLKSISCSYGSSLAETWIDLDSIIVCEDSNYNENLVNLQDKKTILFKDIDDNWYPINELRGLPNCCDTIEVSNISQRYYKRTDVKIINDDEIKLKTSYSNIDYITIPKPINSTHYGNFVKDDYILTDSNFRSYTNAISTWDSSDLIGYLHTPASVDYYWFGVAKGTTLEQAKEMLANKTIIYPLLEEEVYRCSPLDLNTYDGNTIFIVDSGIINPKEFSFSVSNNIGNIVKDVQEDVKDLKDWKNKIEVTTTTKVTTESGFATVEETQNGYFTDIKLEGKSLVNIMGTGKYTFDEKYPYKNFNNLNLLKPNTLYTYMLLGDTKNVSNCALFDSSATEIVFNRVYATKFTFITPSNLNFSNQIRNYVYRDTTKAESFSQDEVDSWKCLILEGDHTQDPPSYFEGISSVGTDVDKIEILSFNENLCPVSEYEGMVINSTETMNQINRVIYRNIRINPDNEYVVRMIISHLNIPGVALFGNKEIPSNIIQHNDAYMFNKNNGGIQAELGKSVKGYKYCTITTGGSFSNSYVPIGEIVKFSNIQLKTVDKNNDYISHKGDRKPLLFKDIDDTWKPISELRGIYEVCDTIEKHSNGKYYYHQRTKKIDLNGSELWQDYDNVELLTTTYTIKVGNVKPNSTILCDKFNYVVWGKFINNNVNSITHINNNHIYITHTQSTTLESFKQWLQTNPITVVFALAQEKVFECSPLDLITYENETGFVVNSGAISPKSTLKSQSYIGNIINTLKEKVSTLENNFNNYCIAQNRMMLTSRYNADKVTFKVDYQEIVNETLDEKLDYDLFNLIKNNVLVGKENYDYDDMIVKLDFYVSVKLINWDMWDEIVLIMDNQHNPQIEEIPEGTPIE